MNPDSVEATAFFDWFPWSAFSLPHGELEWGSLVASYLLALKKNKSSYQEQILGITYRQDSGAVWAMDVSTLPLPMAFFLP